MPTSFDEDLADEWSEWVLDHGLPELPVRVRIGQSVPIAYWAGPRVGAVLHRQWAWSVDHHDDQIADNVHHFWRTASGWLKANAEGGSSGGTDDRLQRPQLALDVTAIGGSFQAIEGDRFSWSMDGSAGVEVVAVEVRDSLGVTRRPIDSPLGAFIAATHDRQGASVLAFDREGRTVLHTPFH